MKAWIKGGVIGGIVAFLVSLVLLPFGLTEGHPAVPVLSLITYYLLLIFGKTIAGFIVFIPLMISNNLIIFYILQIFVNVIIYFILGGIIGFLVSRRKYLKRKYYLTGVIIGFIIWLILMYIRILFNIANNDFTGLPAFIIYLALGTILGWIYGKIRNK